MARLQERAQESCNDLSRVVEGLVIRGLGNSYSVLCDDGELRLCMAKGNLRLRGIRSTSPIVVGDRVEVLLTPEGGGEAHFVREILPRRNFIVRRSANLSKLSHILAANLDASYLICTIAALTLINRRHFVSERFEMLHLIAPAILPNYRDYEIIERSFPFESDRRKARQIILEGRKIREQRGQYRSYGRP